MTDDVKVLRECEAQSLKDAKSLGETHPAYATLHKGMAIICRRLADSIEREEAPRPATPSELMLGPDPSQMPPYHFQQQDFSTDAVSFGTPAPSALSEAEDRGWNAAISAVLSEIEDFAVHVDPADYSSAIHDRVRALRREPRK